MKREVIFYLRDRQGRPRVTFVADVDGMHCRVGVARHNPADVLSKAEGRKRARIRLNGERGVNAVDGRGHRTIRAIKDRNGDFYPVMFDFNLPSEDMKQHEIKAAIIAIDEFARASMTVV